MQMKISICFLSVKNCSQPLCRQNKMKKWEGQLYKCGLISLELGKKNLQRVFVIYMFCIIFNCNLQFNRNPTPESSYLSKWEQTNGFPLNYYRIGNLNFETKSMFGMEFDGLFEDRAKFWGELGAFLPSKHIERDEL